MLPQASKNLSVNFVFGNLIEERFLLEFNFSVGF